MLPKEGPHAYAQRRPRGLHQAGWPDCDAPTQRRLCLRGLRALAAMRPATKRSLHREGGSARPRRKTDQASRSARLLSALQRRSEYSPTTRLLFVIWASQACSCIRHVKQRPMTFDGARLANGLNGASHAVGISLRVAGATKFSRSPLRDRSTIPYCVINLD